MIEGLPVEFAPIAVVTRRGREAAQSRWSEGRG